MGLPTFNGFTFNDSNFITERITFKGFAERSVIRAKIARREGVKVLANEFGEKEITIEGKVDATSVSDLQSKLDSMKTLITQQEGPLIIELGRTFTATVTMLGIPDEHYNLTRAPFAITFVCSDPFSVGDSVSATVPLASGITTLSGAVTISGTYFSRPSMIYAPGGSAGNTNIRRLDFTHIATGQTISVSGFGSGLGLQYGSNVVIDFSNFVITENGSQKDFLGSFPKWEPGNNTYILTTTPAQVGGSVNINYSPRYL